MASRVLIHLLLTVILFHVTVANYCKEYVSSSGVFHFRSSCSYLQFCCGTCDNRYCCSNPFAVLTDEDQNACTINNLSQAAIGLIALGISIFVILTLICCCCCCPCCCLYNTCRKPRTVVGTSTTTVVNTQCVMQQPPVQGAQYPPYQPVPTQPPYGGQPYLAQPSAQGPYPAQPSAQGPYQAQPYAPGPPPPYQTVGPAYPSSQAAYPPTQAGFAPLPQPTDTSKQPPYNPAFMQPPPS
ncbi:protein shisa-5-like isoform X2 [Paramisgurnus dabryanus]|uniref:protein shisa-5-like isoform X2 n=1 Tax=Paramisgurnus dabryanus TaxID=90735 RepID=UPI0031F3D75C